AAGRGRAGLSGAGPAGLRARDGARAAGRVRAFLSDGYAAQATLTDLAEVAGCSRFATYRAFRGRFGLSPSDYQRQLRLRAARRALASGAGVADVAAATGVAGQAHLTPRFRPRYRPPPGGGRAAPAPGPPRAPGPGRRSSGDRAPCQAPGADPAQTSRPRPGQARLPGGDARPSSRVNRTSGQGDHEAGVPGPAGEA